MNRRNAVIALISLGFASLATQAEQLSKVRRVGYLAGRSRSTASNPDVYYDAFVQGMRELGYSEGKNLVIEWRFAEGNVERLPMLAAELIALNVEVIATHGTPQTQALMRATNSIPIVFTAVGDPVGIGLVGSLARPEGNVTGLSNIAGDIGPKQIQLLKEMIPKLSRVALLVNPGNASHISIVRTIKSAAQKLGISILVVSASTPADIDRGFDSMSRNRSTAAIVAGDAFFVGQQSRIVQLATTHRIPSMFEFREDAVAGGLLSYGRSQTDMYRQGATYVDKILKGAKPKELPIEQPTRFDLVINRKTANALGLTIPHSLLMRADEVIE
jgi:putative ABC transport system substrate-binding protein